MVVAVLGLRDAGVFEKNHSPGDREDDGDGDGNDDRDGSHDDDHDGGMVVLMGGLFSQTQS